MSLIEARSAASEPSGSGLTEVICPATREYSWIDKLTAIVEDYLAELEAEWRRLDRGQWGLSLPAGTAGDRPLEIGLRVAGDLIQVQALVMGFDHRLDPWLLLHWNRQTRLVRFAATRSGDVWLHVDAPSCAVDARLLDRALGLVVEGAQVARRYAQAVTEEG